jgi:hypothetical protein
VIDLQRNLMNLLVFMALVFAVFGTTSSQASDNSQAIREPLTEKQKEKSRSRARSLFPNRVLEHSEFYAHQLLEIYDEDTHYFLQLGQTTYLMNTFLRKMMKPENIEVALHEAPIVKIGNVTHYLADRSRDGFHKEEDIYWDNLLPSKEELGDREIVISRGIFFGDSMSHALDSLLPYLKRNGYKKKLNLFFTFGTEASALDALERYSDKFLRHGFDYKIHYNVDKYYFDLFVHRDGHRAEEFYTTEMESFSRFLPVDHLEHGQYDRFYLATARKLNPNHFALEEVVQNYLTTKPSGPWRQLLRRFVHSCAGLLGVGPLIKPKFRRWTYE